MSSDETRTEPARRIRVRQRPKNLSASLPSLTSRDFLFQTSLASTLWPESGNKAETSADAATLVRGKLIRAAEWWKRMRMKLKRAAALRGAAALLLLAITKSLSIELPDAAAPRTINFAQMSIEELMQVPLSLSRTDERLSQSAA